MEKKKQKQNNLVLRLCIFVFVAYAVVALIDMQVTLATRQQEVQELEEELRGQKVANNEIERQLKASGGDGYVERIARDQLDYVYPEERVFIDISGS